MDGETWAETYIELIKDYKHYTPWDHVDRRSDMSTSYAVARGHWSMWPRSMIIKEKLEGLFNTFFLWHRELVCAVLFHPLSNLADIKMNSHVGPGFCGSPMNWSNLTVLPCQKSSWFSWGQRDPYYLWCYSKSCYAEVTDAIYWT